MDIVVSQDEGRVPVTVFRLNGDLTSEQPLKSQAEEAYQAGTRDLLLDLSEVPYISSSGLRAIHYVYDLLQSDASDEEQQEMLRGITAGTYAFQHLKLLKPSKNASKALRVAGYDMFLEIHDKYKDAIALF